jgi:hypothetical protein
MTNIRNLITNNLDDPEKIDLLKQEAASYLKKMELTRTKILSERSDNVLSPSALEQYFRSKERNEKISQTLQYLIAFLTHLPGPAELEKEPVNPAEQFREFIRYQVDLLLEDDVKKAVFKEVNQVGSLNGSNVWDYQEQIVHKNRELRELVEKCGSGITKTIATLCQVLEQLSLFWLQIRRGDLHRTRSSDIYLYALSRIVKKRCRQTMDA